MSVIRFAGPFGPRLMKFVLHRRVTWMPETSALRNGQLHLDYVCEYIYQNWAHDKSGEIAMCTHLHPGAYAKRPLCELLVPGTLQPPVSFMYGGGPDWMDKSHGAAVVEQLRGRHYADLWVVPMAGHQLFLDNPKDFNRMLIELVKRCHNAHT